MHEGPPMRKLILIFFILLGAAIGLLASMNGGIALRIVMACVGALFGTAIGGALSRRGRQTSVAPVGDDGLDGHDSPDNQRMSNYWLDRGRPTAAPGLPHPEDADPFSRGS